MKYSIKRFSSSTPDYRDMNTKHPTLGGYGRGVLIGGIPGAIGTYKGGKDALDSYDEGASYDESRSKARKTGAIYGAALGAIPGIPTMLADGVAPGTKAANMVINSGFGALGGALGADKNFRYKLGRRLKKDAESKLAKSVLDIHTEK